MRLVRRMRLMRRMPGSTRAPLAMVAFGMLAGGAGTAAMDLLLYARYKRGGGTDGFPDWELSANLKDWDNASAPALLGKRVVEGVFQRPLPPERAVITNNVVHWATGLGWGAAYGIVAGSAPVPKIRFGLVFGPAVWASSYVILPLAKLYRPIWEYDARTLGKDLSAHLVYGSTSAAAFRILAGRRQVCSLS
jgi:hypothetical protein